MCEAHRVGGCRSVALIPYQPCVEFISKQAHDFLCLRQVLVYRPHEYIVLFIHEFVCDIAVQFHNSGDVHCLVWYCCSGAVRSGRFLSAPALLLRWVRVEDVIFTFRIKNINLCHCDTSRPAVPDTLSLLDVFRLNHPMYISNDSRPASLLCNNSCKYIFPTAISFLPSILAYRTACRLRFCPYQSLQFFDEVSDFHLRFWRKFFSVNVIPSIEFIL